MKLVKIENSLKKIQRQLDNIQKDGTTSALDIDYLKKLTIQFYDEVNRIDQIEEVTVKEEKEHTPFPTAEKEHIPFPTAEKELSVSDTFDNEIDILDPRQVEINEVVQNLNESSVINELFAIPTGSELSDILSNRPIHHISESMGFNERIFTINELFGGSQEEFSVIVDKLNGMSNFDEAQHYIRVEVVQKYGWEKDEMFKKAQTFIRHIQRRYQAVTAE